QNERSRRVIEKVGFTYEGTLRQEFVRFDNRVFDSMVYSMTREEYDQKYRTISYDDVRIY
ncbi:MAG: GNAT family protein, partial [Oscillospiraceae bacterium]